MTTEPLPNSSTVTFDQFREEWLRECTEEDLTGGHRKTASSIYE